MLKKTGCILCLTLTVFQSCDRQRLPDTPDYEYHLLSSIPLEQRPSAIVADAQNRCLYVSLSDPGINQAQRILRIDPDGGNPETIADFLLEPPGPYVRCECVDLALDDESILYGLVRPYVENEIGETEEAPNLLILGYRDGQLLHVYSVEVPVYRFPAIACKNGFLYFTDGLIIRRIEPETGTGETFSIRVSPDTTSATPGPGIFVSDMAVDTEGDIWLTGQLAAFDNWTMGCHITKLSPEGLLISSQPSQAITDNFGSMLNHPGLVLDREDNCYLVTGYCHSLEIYDSRLRFLNMIRIQDENAHPGAVALDDGNVYILDISNSQILVYRKS
ncbi:hypothetical protein JW948_14260 [bacterium]|nr:hypothetical protein [bacterium]